MAGRLSLLDHPLAPRALGSPVHTHRDEDEYFMMLEGIVGAQIADQAIEAGGLAAACGLRVALPG